MTHTLTNAEKFQPFHLLPDTLTGYFPLQVPRLLVSENILSHFWLTALFVNQLSLSAQLHKVEKVLWYFHKESASHSELNWQFSKWTLRFPLLIARDSHPHFAEIDGILIARGILGWSRGDGKRGLGKKWVGGWHVWKANCSVIAHSYEISSRSTICAHSLSMPPGFGTKECVSSRFSGSAESLLHARSSSEILQPFPEALIPSPSTSDWHSLPSARSSSCSAAVAGWSWEGSAALQCHLPALRDAERSSRRPGEW